MKTRSRIVIFGLATAVLLSGLSVASTAGAVEPGTVTGRATALSVRVPGSPDRLVADTGAITSPGNSTTDKPVATYTAGSVSATGLGATVQTFLGAGTARATASSVQAGSLIVKGADASVSASCEAASGVTRLTHLALGSKVVIDAPSTPAPNTDLSTNGVRIIVNEQIPSVRGNGMTVRAVHVSLPDGTEVVVGAAETAVGCSDEPSSISPGRITLTGASPQSFAPINPKLRFDITGATFATGSSAVRVEVNGTPVATERLTTSETSVSVAATLVEGANDVQLLAHDQQGRALLHRTMLWAGTRKLRVVLSDAGGPVDGATALIKLGDDAQVRATRTTAAGAAEFSNLPDRTVIVEGSGSGNRFGTVATHGGAVTVGVRLLGFSSPSTVDNNDFSQNTAGWEIGSAPVQIVPHSEGSAPSSALVPSSTDTALPQSSRAERDASLKAMTQAQVTATATSSGDNDLVLNTAGEGPQTISRAFTISPEIKAVRVRYRFITSEVPGGYFGTKFNDYFNVSIRTAGGGALADANTMNGLGLAAFDAAGATAWRESKLAVDTAGDTVQVDVTVANVADGLFGSQVVVDLVEIPKVTISDLRAVVRGDTTSVDVKVGKPDTKVELKLSTTSGTGRAAFAANGGDTLSITGSKPVVIRGVTESSKHDNIRLLAKTGDDSSDTEKFSVLWVTLSLRTTGGMSGDNIQAGPIQKVIGNGLGVRVAGGHWSTMVELVGTVSPSDFPHPIAMRRQRVAARTYVGSSRALTLPSDDDTSYPGWFDDDPRPKGNIYDVDGPSIWPIGTDPVGTIVRYRGNFFEYAEFEGKKCSEDLQWFARLSVRKTATGEVLAADITSDNKAGPGVTPTSWNLR